jgi:peptide deformylase
LAAPQVGVLKRLVVVYLPPDYDEEGDPELQLMLVNPEVVKAGGREVCPEGCLSFPELVGDVPRYTSLNVRARDLEGRELRIRARGYLARVLQHEIDHLDGILFFDRMDDYSTLRYPQPAVPEDAAVAETLTARSPAG